MMEGMLIGIGFTGALSLVFLARGLARRIGLLPVMRAHFSPKGGCSAAIVTELKHARKEILVQAYSFTCPEIAAALVEAKARGVSVKIVLDKANEKESYSELGVMEKLGMDVTIDAQHAIAHNKVMIIDRWTLITGSFNFTRQAEHENAENMLIVHGHPDLLDGYLRNFEAHHAHSHAPGAVTPAAHPRGLHEPVPTTALAEIKH